VKVYKLTSFYISHVWFQLDFFDKQESLANAR